MTCTCIWDETKNERTGTSFIALLPCPMFKVAYAKAKTQNFTTPILKLLNECCTVSTRLFIKHGNHILIITEKKKKKKKRKENSQAEKSRFCANNAFLKKKKKNEKMSYLHFFFSAAGPRKKPFKGDRLEFQNAGLLFSNNTSVS